MTSKTRSTTTTALAVAITAVLFAAPSYAALKKPTASKAAPAAKAAVKKPVFGKPAQPYGTNLKAPADTHYQEFIVSFHKGSKASADLRRQLDAVGRQIGARINIERTLGTGAELIRLDRQIDVVERKALEVALMKHPSIRAVEPNGFAHRMLEPNDPMFGQQWHYRGDGMGINATEAWDSVNGEGFVVAVLDTGEVDHEDLQGQFIAGYDFITDPANSRDGDGRDADPSDEGDWDDKYDSSWHGTHVAGTVAALTDNNLGVAGVAHGAKVQHVRVLGNLGGAWTDVSDAIIWAAGGSVPGVPDNATPADVINLSLGGGVPCQVFMQDAVTQAVELGTLVVAAAGNSSADVANFSPGGCDGAMAIAGTGPDNTRYASSNFGHTISVAAPAGSGSLPEENQVLSTINLGATIPGDDGYAWYAGTSMAAPHVAGTAALVLEAAESNGETLTPARIRRILENTAWSSNGFVTNCDTSARWCASLIDAGLAVAVAAGDEDLPDDPPPPPPPPPPVPLVNGVPVELGAMAGGTDKFFVLEVPEGQGNVTFTLTPATGAIGDSDLYVREGQPPSATLYDCRPYTGGVTLETCVFANPEPGEWHVRVAAFNASNGYSIEGSYSTEGPPEPEFTELENGVAETGISVAAGAEALFAIDLPEGATDLRVQMAGGTGDADLYVRHGGWPTSSVYDCRPFLSGNNELCTFATPDDGRWYIRLAGFSSATGISLTASYTEGTVVEVPTDLEARHAFGLKGQLIRVPLTWNSEGEVDVRFNGAVVATTELERYTHTFKATSVGAGSATYQVCNAGSSTECSETITVTYTARR